MAPTVPIPTSLSSANQADSEEAQKGSDEPCTPRDKGPLKKEVPDAGKIQISWNYLTIIYHLS